MVAVSREKAPNFHAHSCTWYRLSLLGTTVRYIVLLRSITYSDYHHLLHTHSNKCTFLRLSRNPGGKLALSGVLEEQADAVLAAYAANFDLSVTERLGGWVLLSGVRREA